LGDDPLLVTDLDVIEEEEDVGTGYPKIATEEEEELDMFENDV